MRELDLEPISHENLKIDVFMGENSRAEWRDVVEVGIGECGQHKIKLLVVDKVCNPLRGQVI